MRLIDADAYSAEMKDRQEAAWKWRNEAIAEEDEVKTARAEGAFTAFTEAKLTMDKHIISPWHRVEEPPKEGTWCVIAKHSYLQPHNLFYDIAHYLHGTFSVYDSGVGDWFDGKPLYWMPIEPPQE